MEELRELISPITKFGVLNQREDSEKDNSLKKALVRLYAYCLEISFLFDENDYPNPPDFGFDIIRGNVEKNFPNFGYYNEVSDLKSVNAEIYLGDSVDDLSDIIKDLMEVNWRIDNTSANDALWFLKFSFHNHFEQHLIGLLNFIKNIEMK